MANFTGLQRIQIALRQIQCPSESNPEGLSSVCIFSDGSGYVLDADCDEMLVTFPPRSSAKEICGLIYEYRNGEPS